MNKIRKEDYCKRGFGRGILTELSRYIRYSFVNLFR